MTDLNTLRASLNSGEHPFADTLAFVAAHYDYTQTAFDNGGLGRDVQLPAPEGERVVPLVLQEGTFPVIGAVTRDFLVQMQHDGSSPTLHDLRSPTPRDNVAEQHPEEFQRLLALGRGLHEAARLQMYRNVQAQE